MYTRKYKWSFECIVICIIQRLYFFEIPILDDLMMTTHVCICLIASAMSARKHYSRKGKWKTKWWNVSNLNSSWNIITIIYNRYHWIPNCRRIYQDLHIGSNNRKAYTCARTRVFLHLIVVIGLVITTFRNYTFASSVISPSNYDQERISKSTRTRKHIRKPVWSEQRNDKLTTCQMTRLAFVWLRMTVAKAYKHAAKFH